MTMGKIASDFSLSQDMMCHWNREVVTAQFSEHPDDALGHMDQSWSWT